MRKTILCQTTTECAFSHAFITNDSNFSFSTHLIWTHEQNTHKRNMFFNFMKMKKIIIIFIICIFNTNEIDSARIGSTKFFDSLTDCWNSFKIFINYLHNVLLLWLILSKLEPERKIIRIKNDSSKFYIWRPHLKRLLRILLNEGKKIANFCSSQ